MQRAVSHRPPCATTIPRGRPHTVGTLLLFESLQVHTDNHFVSDCDSTLGLDSVTPIYPYLSPGSPCSGSLNECNTAHAAHSGSDTHQPFGLHNASLDCLPQDIHLHLQCWHERSSGDARSNAATTLSHYRHSSREVVDCCRLDTGTLQYSLTMN